MKSYSYRGSWDKNERGVVQNKSSAINVRLRVNDTEVIKMKSKV